MKRKAVLWANAATLLFFAAACLFLYQFDNKYTHSVRQPVNGVLSLSEEDLAQAPVRYLIYDWEYFPNVLLTPDEIAQGGHYRVYHSIGTGRAVSHGSGTYRLTLLLPKEKRTYALELPEIFSACRLYCDGQLTAELGNTDPEAYRQDIANRIVTFPAGGRVELVLSYTDFSGIYSGMTYPPAFGMEQNMFWQRDIRLLVHGAGILIGIAGAAFSLCYSLPGRRRRLFSVLCCLCFAGITGYPVFHSLFTVSFLPWYAVEILFYYGLLLCAIELTCDLYEVSPEIRRLLAAPCWLMLPAAAARAIFAGQLGPQAAVIFSWMSRGVKWYAALILVGLSFWALHGSRIGSPLALCGSSALAVCLVFDRIFPLYEPIYGGWFAELGGAGLAIALLLALGQEMTRGYRDKLLYENQYHHLQRRLGLQKEHYQLLSQQVEQARRATHDLRHHMRVLRTFAVQADLSQLLCYLNKYETHFDEQEVTVFSDNPVADAILLEYSAAARRLDAVFDVRFPLPPDFAFPDDELCVLLSNLLENAMEAMARQKSGERRLYLRGDVEGGRLRLIVKNTFSGELLRRGSTFASTKPGSLGLGLRSVLSIAQKYGGLADFSVEGALFCAMVVVPLAELTRSADPTEDFLTAGSR